MNKPILTKHSLVPRIPYLLSSESSNYILKSSNYSLLTKEDFSELISPNKIFNLSFRTATLANLTVYQLATSQFTARSFPILFLLGYFFNSRRLYDCTVSAEKYCPQQWWFSVLLTLIKLNPYWVLIHLNIILRTRVSIHHHQSLHIKLLQGQGF